MVLVSNNSISYLIESFSITGSESGSTVIRIQEVSYYWEQFTSSVFWGMGGLSDAINSPYSSIVHSKIGIYYLDDIGYLGTLVNGGLLLIGILLWMYRRMLKVTSCVIKAAQASRYSYALAIMVYLLVSDVTLSLVLTQKTSIFLPVIIVIFELISDEISNKKLVKI